MIRLQVNHEKHNPLRTVLIKKHHSQTTQHTSQNETQTPQQNIQVPQQQTKVYPHVEKDKQLKVIDSIQATTVKVKKDLQQLINEYKSQAQKMMLNHGYDPQKQASIRQHLRRLQQQKKQRRARFERDLARLNQKKEELQRSCEDSCMREERRKSIEQRIKKIKQRQKRRRQSEAEFIKFYQHYKQQKPKYQQMEQEFKKKEEHEKEEKLTAFKHKVEEIYQPMNLQQISSFEEEYLQQKRQAEKMRLKNHLQQRKKEQLNLARLNDLYKGHCHTNILRELQQRKSKTNQSYEKSKRIKQYSEIVKEEYKPTARLSDEAALDEEESNCPKTERGKRVIKERYVHGQYLGKKIQYEKVPLSHSQHINKGIEYLQFLKKLPKRPKTLKKEAQASVMTSRKKTVESVYRVQRELNPLYRGRAYNSIDFSHLQDRQSVNRMMDVMRQRKRQLELDEKVLKNGNFQDRCAFMLAQKDYNNKLVSNIQSKLSILKKL